MLNSDKETDTSRRTFMVRATAVIMGIIGLFLSIPLIGYIVSPALKRRVAPSVKVGSLKDLVKGQPRELELVFAEKDGWMETKTTRAVWVIEKDSVELKIYNPHCTHLGCAYHWNSEEDLFKCPCHNGVYDIDGKVVSGPPPRPLDTLNYYMENEDIYVYYEDFRAGSTKKIPL